MKCYTQVKWNLKISFLIDLFQNDAWVLPYAPCPTGSWDRAIMGEHKLYGQIIETWGSWWDSPLKFIPWVNQALILNQMDDKEPLNVFLSKERQNQFILQEDCRPGVCKMDGGEGQSKMWKVGKLFHEVVALTKFSGHRNMNQSGVNENIFKWIRSSTEELAKVGNN